jgi:hypothetical protein
MALLLIIAQLPRPVQGLFKAIIPSTGTGSFEGVFGRMPQASLECFQELRPPPHKMVTTRLPSAPKGAMSVKLPQSKPQLPHQGSSIIMGKII